MSKRGSRWKKGCLSAFTVVSLAVGWVFWAYGDMLASPTWDSVQETVERDFPGVDHVSSHQLAVWQADGVDLLLIDSRGAREVAVSRIPGAIHLTTPVAVEDHMRQRLRPPTRIVVYCSVGWRSSRLASQLVGRGQAQIPVHNLQGSIFMWSNEGRPLVDGDDKPTDKVHPWMRSWGRHLLRPGSF